MIPCPTCSNRLPPTEIAAHLRACVPAPAPLPRLPATSLPCGRCNTDILVADLEDHAKQHRTDDFKTHMRDTAVVRRLQRIIRVRHGQGELVAGDL